ncbi:hypothetical protein RB195_002609 [Necator americanus]|uniref:Xylose isomerase-like TIM barrel domain-containing protein n=1 Tax=Necator americanus TaxID=51031 RepID=A0ABR1DJT9_NECAM
MLWPIFILDALQIAFLVYAEQNMISALSEKVFTHFNYGWYCRNAMHKHHSKLIKSMEVAGNTFHYAELNVRHTGNADRTLAMVKRAVKMGYDTVAINIDIGDIVPSESIDEHMLPQPSLENTDKPPPKKKPRKDEDRKGREQQLPEPFLINESQLDLSDLQRLGKKFRQFSMGSIRAEWG